MNALGAFCWRIKFFALHTGVHNAEMYHQQFFVIANLDAPFFGAYFMNCWIILCPWLLRSLCIFCQDIQDRCPCHQLENFLLINLYYPFQLSIDQTIWVIQLKQCEWHHMSLTMISQSNLDLTVASCHSFV